MFDDGFQTTIRLLRGVRTGDRQALEDLFARYLPKVRRIVALRLGYRARELASFEDLVQDSLLRVFQKLDQFEEMTEGTFLNWVASCVASAVHLHFKKEGAKKRGEGKVRVLSELGSEGLTDSILGAPGAGPTTRARAAELEEKTEEILLEMKTHYLKVIDLKYLCGMNSGEIAAEMGFAKAATARKTLSRALDDLKERLRAAGFSDS